MKTSRLLIISVVLGSLLSFFSCGSSEKDREAQRLNDIAYKLHYRKLDDVKVYADSVLNNPDYSDEAKAEALNNLVFYHIGKMNYDVADSLSRHVYDLTDNHIELLIASVQQMRLCQRRSDNKNFYEHRQLALQHLQRINEEDRSVLTNHQLKRLVYAESEMHIVESAYYYYVGLTEQSNAAIDTLDEELIIHNDTAQYLAYLYNVGSGGYLNEGTVQDIQQEEFGALMDCYLFSIQYGYPYWEANALQALSDHFLSDRDNNLLMDRRNQSDISYLNTDDATPENLAGNLALRAKDLFASYGDVYQTAAAWRTLSNCYFQIKDYPGAVYCLQQALKDKKVEQAPSLLASIHEDLSITFAALDDKVQSDNNRNAYLDMQEKTRQDKQLEARAEQLKSSLQIMDAMVWVIVGVLALLAVALIVLLIRRSLSKRKGDNKEGTVILKYRKGHNRRLEKFEEEQEELEEKIGVASLSLERQQETYEEHRAKMHLIDSLTPLIDRMLHEIKMLSQEDKDIIKENNDTRSQEEYSDIQNLRHQRAEYIVELAEQINRENNFLTEWIRLKQGELSLRIETFDLEDVLSIVRQSATTFRMAGIQLLTENSSLLTIKADKTLTLFMINTLCDNARKFTSRGGTVSVDAKEVADDMVEISVSDTGKGMTQEQKDNIFVAKPITDEIIQTPKSKAQDSSAITTKSHGFGLLNCKGIIEKYKKTSPLFSHCSIGVESKVGEGTRFFFRLPKGVKHFIMLMLCILSCTMAFAETKKGEYSKANDPRFKLVYALTDSIYQSNVNGTYSRTIDYAYRCINEINRLHKQLHNDKKPERTVNDTTAVMQLDSMLMVDNISATSAEVCWFRDSIGMPFDAILTLRNEVAVASLALHDWYTYNYNNKVYTQLFREMSVDHTLGSFCQQMQQAESNRTVAMMLLVILLLAFFPVFYFLYYRHVISDNKKAIEDMKAQETRRCQELDDLQAKLSQLNFEVDRLYVSNNVMSNSLSTIKHETMYYPSRLRQMFEIQNSKLDTQNTEGAEVARYYRSLYEILTKHARYNCRHQLDAHLLRDMLLKKLARISGQRKADLKPSSADDSYATYEIQMTKPDDIILRLCTQIVRDLGEQCHLRRCGIIRNNDKLQITIPNGKF